MPTNLIIGYPAIPFAGTQSISATASTSYPASNLTTGGRGQGFELATAQFDDLYIQYDAGSSTAATGLAIARAKLLTSGNCNRVVLRNCSQPYNLPSTITGLIGWWDATRGVTKDGSDRVSQWNDISGNAQHVIQGTGGSQPLWTAAASGTNSNPHLYFDGTRRMAASAIGSVAQPRTQFVVANTTANPGGTQAIMMDGNGASNRSAIGWTTTTNLRAFAGTSLNGTPAAAYNSTAVYSVVFNGASSQFWQNGVSVTTGDAGSQAYTGTVFGSASGATNFLTGNICEGLVYNSALSASDRQAVEAYLTAKWLTTPIYTNTALTSSALKGPTSEDLISVFNSSSARYWWFQFGTATTSKFKHNKEFLGTFFDFGKEPVYSGFSTPIGVRGSRAREPRRRFTLKWLGVTNTIRNSFISSVYRYRDASPVMLYDQNNYLFNGAYAIHASIRGATFSNRTADTSDVAVEFEEVI